MPSLNTAWMQVYPATSESKADLLCANEAAAHASLQQLFLGTTVPGSNRIAHLFGSFKRPNGEQVCLPLCLAAAGTSLTPF